MEEIYKSILIGVFTTSLFVVASIIINNDDKEAIAEEKIVPELIADKNKPLWEH